MPAAVGQRFEIIHGEALASLACLRPGSVHTAVTSPPYFGQRAYGDNPDEIGREATPQAYLGKLAAVFVQIHRVLRDDGTLWLNMADKHADSGDRVPSWGVGAGSVMLLPFRLADALQRSGWCLRQTLIWKKENAPPETVANRPTTQHEYVFLLTKRPTGYYYDWLAAAVPNKGEKGINTDILRGITTPDFALAHRVHNRRSVLSTFVGQGSAAGHPAPFPQELVSPLILMGTSNAGVCPRCGAPYVRTIERHGLGVPVRRQALADTRNPAAPDGDAARLRGRYSPRGDKALDAQLHRVYPDVDKGFQPSCDCAAGQPIPAAVLDPFCGAGSAGVAALSLGRRFLGIDLSETFATAARRRLEAL